MSRTAISLHEKISYTVGVAQDNQTYREQHVLRVCSDFLLHGSCISILLFPIFPPRPVEVLKPEDS